MMVTEVKIDREKWRMRATIAWHHSYRRTMMIKKISEVRFGWELVRDSYGTWENATKKENKFIYLRFYKVYW